MRSASGPRRGLIASACCALAACATAGGTAPAHPSGRMVTVDAAKLPFVREIDERFMSFQIGFSHLTGGETWKSYDALPGGSKAAEQHGFAAIREARAPSDLNSRRLRALTRALSPLYVRYSGTTANSVYFHDHDTPPPTEAPEGFTVVLTRSAWKGAIDFAGAVDAKIVTSFANSPGVRDSAGVWTPAMAAPWLAYTRSVGGEIYAAELFNEPNAPEPPRIPQGHGPREFARDSAAFRRFLASAEPRLKVAGPGNAVLGVPVPVSSLDRITPEQYAAAKPAPRFDIVSYHFYPALAERCARPDAPEGIAAAQALSEDWLARPDAQARRFRTLRDRYAPGAPLWITETGGAACGGLRWQPTFLDAFRFLDTHARLARQGVDAMFTHALISGSNGIIDEKTLEPNASYWAALLWRRLIGTRVLDTGEVQPGLHVYAHCQRGAAGGVTLLALNLEPRPATLQVPRRAELYALTAPELQSKTVLLNGNALAIGPGDALPAIVPARAGGSRVSLAPSSINFITLPGARNRQCLGSRINQKSTTGGEI